MPRTTKIPTERAPDALIRSKRLDSYPCVVCGLPVNRPKLWVHVVNGGGEALHCGDEQDYVADGGDMGLLPIGPNCARRHPELKPYLHR